MFDGAKIVEISTARDVARDYSRRVTAARRNPHEWGLCTPGCRGIFATLKNDV
jgi:hypothetical protein